jgi:putative CocE/NonD family hydrolase
LYLHANGKLSFDPPSPGESAFDEYTSDPEHPVPYIPYAATDVQAEYMFADQRFTEKRPDVLTYVSDPLEQDITVAGPVSPHLQVSSSGTDSDFDVKLIDVFPGNSQTNDSQQEPGRADVPIADEQTKGYEQLVRGEPMRAKFRTSWARPQPLAPNQITPVNFDMPDVNHTFQRGHRIMVQIQSSWFPLTDLNPQTFISTTQARPADFVKAIERVYHTPQAASGIVIGVLPNR